MIQISDYLKLGFRGIVFLGVTVWTEDSPQQTKHTVQELACFDRDGMPQVLSIHWKEKILANGSQQACKIEAQEVISQHVYEELVNSNGVQDDVMYYQAAACRDRERREVEKEIMNLTPKCPICGNLMILKKKAKNNSFYWECIVDGKGKCQGSRSVPVDVLARYQNLLSRQSNIGI